MATVVQQQYDRLADIYDQRWQTYIAQTLSFLIDWAQIQPQDTVLDVACGTGELERRLSLVSPNITITGVDFSAAMLAIARLKCQDLATVQFYQALATRLPWATSQFDVVVCANAFHYFDHPAQVLAEMARVLHSPGRVVILDWCRDFWLCQLCDWWLGWRDPAHKQCYTEAELHQLLEQAGFQRRRSQRVRFGWLWGLMIVEAEWSSSTETDASQIVASQTIFLSSNQPNRRKVVTRD